MSKINELKEKYRLMAVNGDILLGLGEMVMKDLEQLRPYVFNEEEITVLQMGLIQLNLHNSNEDYFTPRILDLLSKLTKQIRSVGNTDEPQKSMKFKFGVPEVKKFEDDLPTTKEKE